jgi:hypothetical protein
MPMRYVIISINRQHHPYGLHTILSLRNDKTSYRKEICIEPTYSDSLNILIT